MTETKSESKAHAVARIQERIGPEHRVTADVLPEDSGYRGTVVVLSTSAAERVADLLDVLARLRGEAMLDMNAGADPLRALLRANENDLERQGGGRTWTVRLVVAQKISQDGRGRPTFDELLAARAMRMLSPAAAGPDAMDVVELAPPTDVPPKDSHEWATAAAACLAGLGFNAVAAPAWGRS